MKSKLNYFFAIPVLILTFAFGYYFQTQKVMMAPASSESSNLSSKDLTQLFESIEFDLDPAQQGLDSKCSQKLNDYFTGIYNLSVGDSDISDLKSNAQNLIQQSFALRIKLRERLAEYINRNGDQSIDPACVFNHRKLFRGLRVLEDYLGMLHVGSLQHPKLAKPTSKPNAPWNVFEGNDSNILWNEKYRPADANQKYIPQSGDVLISRGNASVSAAIARITDEDSNFSHVAVVYVDGKTVETIEAHIEIGSVVEPFEKYNDGKQRSVVFRLNIPGKSEAENRALAHEAARNIRQVVKDYHEKNKTTPFPNICYDFAMNIDNPSQFSPERDLKKQKCLFCSEVASLAFKNASRGVLNIPMFQSSMNPKNKKFLTDIGVTVSKTFAPADMEIEPRFDLVLEWRDYHRVHKTHQMDAILTTMYHWMDTHSYEFKVPVITDLISRIGFIGRRIPFLDHKLDWKFLLQNKFPLNMSKSALNTMVMLDKVANQMAALIQDTEASRGITLTPAQMVNLLNENRMTTEKKYKTSDIIGPPKQN